MQFSLVSMSLRSKPNLLWAIIPLAQVLLSSSSCLGPTLVQVSSNSALVELTPIDVDRKNPERKNFGALTLLSAFHLRSHDKRFGGISGLSIATDGKLYAVSDNGYWLSAKIKVDQNGALVNLIDWQIAPILSTTNTPVTGALRDAEALANAGDGSFLVAFEGAHRIWRYSPPPETFQSMPIPVPIPPHPHARRVTAGSRLSRHCPTVGFWR
jgi:hypothetical protein